MFKLKLNNTKSSKLTVAYRVLIAGLGILLVCSIAISAKQAVFAAPSNSLNFQARLYSSSGNTVPDGTYNIEFKIYDSLAAGASTQGACTGGATDDCVWVETRTGANQVTVKNGYFSVALGDVIAFPDINWDQELFLTMNIGGTGGTPTWDGEMTPRIKLTSVPYAFQANTARQLEVMDSGFTGNLSFGTLTADRNVLLPNASGTVILDSTLGSTAFLQNGNSFGQAAVLGTNDTFDLQLKTNGITRLTIDTSGNATLTGNLTVSGTGTSSFAGALQVDGNTILGSDAADTLTINGTTVTIPNNLNIDSGTLFVDAVNNRIGIGTITPSARLQIVGANQATADTAAEDALVVVGGQGGIASVTAGGGGGAISLTGGQGGNGTATLPGGDGGNVTIQGGAAGTDNGAGTGSHGNLLLQTNGGNVGIGDATPVALFTVGAGDLFQIDSSGAIVAATGMMTTGNFSQTGSGTFSTGTGTISLNGNTEVTGSNTFTVGTGATSLGGTLSVTGIVTLGTLGIADGNAQLCQNSSGQIATCDTSGGTQPFVQGGNSFGAEAILGTNDTFGLTLETDNIARLTITSDGNVGIGTGVSTPASKVHIQGSADDEQLIVQGFSTQTANIMEVRDSVGTALVSVTGTGLLKVGTTAAPTLGTARLLVTEAEVTTRFRIGDGTNGVSFNDEISGQLRFRGNARPTRSISLIPEFAGATLTGDGTNNIGTMTSDFCSGTSRRSINTTICSANDEHNYYSWTAQATNDYDVYVRYQLPTDFDGFASDDAIRMFGWRSTSNEKVELSIFNANGVQCGTTTVINTVNTTWEETPLAGAETTESACSVANMAPGSNILIRIRLTVGSNNNFARAGGITMEYLSKF